MEKGSVIRDTNGEDMRRPISAFFSDYRPTGRSRRERSVRVQEEAYLPEEKSVSALHPEYTADGAEDSIDTDEVPWEAEGTAANGRSAGV